MIITKVEKEPARVKIYLKDLNGSKIRAKLADSQTAAQLYALSSENNCYISSCPNSRGIAFVGRACGSDFCAFGINYSRRHICVTPSYKPLAEGVTQILLEESLAQNVGECRKRGLITETKLSLNCF